ncbi:TetR/AcrR family transcriptional regulator [Thauera chlorobenzoica]|uniref:Transcriptional regulator, TetR family n=1 Tax=Thauera chlorobenzoica TaxID=96773 RepID=A0A1H5S8D7_9RHOO|nr:TetR/AcrR family transcriptional regulator [Thauera chlorobenzoica]APR04949.1 Transcriptional regulator, TetR family [Thauera chlorobenzoica]SEF46077.1 DNA-binding transcriptional regulator, AcrR family [Thauera chlorobenzoica]
MARGKAATFELQRGAIQEAAADLIAAKGFHNTSMAEIARTCGVSKPLLYHYYRDKEHILFDIADFHVDRLLKLVEDVLAGTDAPRLQLERMICRFLDVYVSGRSFHVVLVQDVKFLHAVQREQIIDKERRIVGAFADTIEGIEPGLRGQRLDKAVTMVLFGMINWTFSWLRAEGELSSAEMGPLVTRIFLHGVTGLAQEAPGTVHRSPAAVV